MPVPDFPPAPRRCFISLPFSWSGGRARWVRAASGQRRARGRAVRRSAPLRSAAGVPGAPALPRVLLEFRDWVIKWSGNACCQLCSLLRYERGCECVFFFSFGFYFLFIFIFPLPDAFLGVLRNLAVPGNCALRKFWEVKPGCSFLFPYA